MTTTPPPFASESSPSKGYFVKLFGEVLGPFTEEEIRQGAEAGDFPEDATISLEGAGDWYPVREYKKLTQPVLKVVPPPFSNKLVPPPFKQVVPPPFKKPNSDAA